MSLETGAVFGHYKVQALLGSGGMGEVYRALDTRLGRVVALKVIAPRVFGDPSLRRRFEIEARAASALNHPSVVTVYDVGETDGISWIALEWVEGRTLREALAHGALPLGDAIAVSRQVAGGLAAAHAKGVVHRDLKPENIMLTVDGRAKIVDFGLARQTIVDALEESDLDTPQAPAGVPTVEGSILGTVGYMSPEQASGKPADFRSDQFSFGLIVYEMLAGRRAFQRGSAVETLSAIIREDPVPVTSLREGIPEAVQYALGRCLSKNPESRFASTGDLASTLEGVTIERGPESSRLPAELSLPPTEIFNRTARAPASRPSRRAIVTVVVVAAIAAMAAAMGWIRLHAPPAAIHSLDVLPFENATNDPDADYLAAGVTEGLIDQMSQIPALKVMARTTVMQFKGTTDAREAGKRLGVGAVLIGTISKRGAQLVISAELVDTANGARLWGRTYDRPAADLLHVQDSITGEIVDGLRLNLSGEERRSLASHGTDDPEAYQLFLRARFMLQYDTEEDDLEARRLYLQALEKDPRFADAHVGVGSTYARSAGSGYAPPVEGWLKADEEARKALQLDPDNFGARVMLAGRFLFNWDWATAEREFLELANDPRIFQGLGYHPVALYFWGTGRTERSVALLEQALRVDPGNVESRVMLANFLAHSGRLDDAVRLYTAIAEAEPLDPRPLFGLAQVLRRRHDAPGAISTLQKAFELAEEQEGVEALATARSEADYDRAHLTIARRRLESLQALAKERYVSPFDLSRLHVQIGEHESAFAMLDQAVLERSLGLVLLKVDQVWDPVRQDPRFVAMVRRIGIP